MKNRCGVCRVLGHTVRHCPKRPDATVLIRVPEESAEQILWDRLRPLQRASMWDENVLRCLMLSCYLQGALDALTPECQAALREKT